MDREPPVEPEIFRCGDRATMRARDRDRRPSFVFHRERELGGRLMLPRSVRERVAAWAHAGYPRESCGLLVGRSSLGAVRVTAATRARNLEQERARERFELDPRDLLATERAAGALGREIVGVWHSHPDQSARPSEEDRLAAWRGWSYVIVAVTQCGAGAMRSWRLASDRFFEETLLPELA